MLDSPQEFHPVLLSRRGELTAWALALLVIATWAFLVLIGGRLFLAIPIVAVFLLFSAASISLGNWMDRNTVLRLDKDGLSFQNGLRNVRLGWREINQVQVWPAQWGKKVEVIGDQAHFQFRTPGEVKVQGETKGRLGLERGEEALRLILRNSGLHSVDHPGEGYLYARK